MRGSWGNRHFGCGKDITHCEVEVEAGGCTEICAEELETSW